MSEMVERVALALMEEGGLSAIPARGLARIVIAAMREPTENMADDAREHWDLMPVPEGARNKRSPIITRAIWVAMIDAALSAALSDE
jgi:hypothetical protein